MVLWRNGCFLLLAASALSPSFAQDPLEYLEENTEVVMTKPLSTGVGPGNGVFVFDNKVYVITDDCTVYHLDSTSLDTIWQFPSTAGTTCSSGLYFSESYMAFSAETSSGRQVEQRRVSQGHLTIDRSRSQSLLLLLLQSNCYCWLRWYY